MYKSERLAEFVKEKTKIKSAYMWGDYGRTITESTISQKARQYPSRYPAARQELLRSYIGKGYAGCDCVGLYKWFLWTDGGTKSAITYNSATDRSVSGMYNAATERGDISTLPEIVGVILYMNGHMGVYIGNGEAVECTLSSYGDGIVKSKVEGRGWTHWLKMPEIEYGSESSSGGSESSGGGKKSIEEVAKDVINGDYGNGAERKAALEAAGYDYAEVQSEVNRQLYGSGGTEPEKGNEATTTTMTVVPPVGLWLNNSDKRWNTSTHIVCMPKGAKVKVYNGSEKKLGDYTCVKVLYGSTEGYCAKEYLR